MSIALNNWKEFWIIRIDALKLHKGVHQNQLVENEGSDDNDVWKKKIRERNTFENIRDYTKRICQDIYTKATKNKGAFSGNNLLDELQPLVPGEGNYPQTVFNTLYSFEREVQEISQVFHDKIGVEFDNSNVVDQLDGTQIAAWKDFINSKIPKKEIKLTDIPEDKDLADLLYTYDLYRKISHNLPRLTSKLAGDDRISKFGFKWEYKVNNATLQEYKNSKKTITNAETYLGLNSGDLATITTNAAYNLKGKTLAQLLIPHTCPPCALNHCPNTHADYDTIKGKSNEYQRIHTKLSGKISNDDLTNLLNSAPSCSHSDYDDIKQALADEKEKLTKQKESFELEKQEAQVQKEKEIISKIITDLGLTTERERERESIRSSNYGN